jgi:hypothetical protein
VWTSRTTASPPTPGSVDHADADQLDVSSQPRLGDLRLQLHECVVSPPLALLTRVAVGEADEHLSVVRVGEAKPVPEAAFVPDSPASGLVVGVVAED